jgi:hypothetical protein
MSQAQEVREIHSTMYIPDAAGYTGYLLPVAIVCFLLAAAGIALLVWLFKGKPHGRRYTPPLKSLGR